jgi:hypothetical protein
MCENQPVPDSGNLVAATLEKAIAYVFAESPFRKWGGQEFDPPLLHQKLLSSQ